MSELGEIFREAREARGISIAEAEEATKIRRKYLQALEDAEYDILPPTIYARGFIRNYASYLGLNPDEVLAAYRNGTAERLQPAEPHIISEPLAPSPRISLELIAGIVILAVVGVLAVVIYRRYVAPLAGGPGIPTPTVAQALGLGATDEPAFSSPNDPTVSPEPRATPTPLESTSAPATPTPTALPTETPNLEPTPPAELVLKFAATADTWIRVEVDGDIAFQGILTSGDQATWIAKREIALRTGNAGGSTVSINEQDLGTLGASGEVLDFVWQLTDDGQLLTNPPTP